MKSIAATSKTSIRLAVLCAVVSLASIGGFAGGDVAADTLIPRESVGAPGGGGGSADGSPPEFAVNQNLQSILLIEGKEVPNEVVSATEGVYYAIVDDQGSAYAPEQLETASNDQTASSAQSGVQMICPPCATLV